MSQIKGRDGSITFDSNAVGELRSFSISMDQATVQTTYPTMATPAPALTFVAAESQWSGSAEVYFDSADAGFGFAALDDGSSNWGNGTAATLVGVVEDNTTDGQVSGSILITNVTINSSVDGMVEATISFQGTGELALQTAAA